MKRVERARASAGACHPQCTHLGVHPLQEARGCGAHAHTRDVTKSPPHSALQTPPPVKAPEKQWKPPPPHQGPAPDGIRQGSVPSGRCSGHHGWGTGCLLRGGGLTGPGNTVSKGQPPTSSGDQLEGTLPRASYQVSRDTVEKVP